MKSPYKHAQYLPVNNSEQARECHEDDEKYKAEDKYDMFRKMSSKTVWADFCTFMKGYRRERGD